MYIVKYFIVGKVIGRLEQDTLRVVVAHTVAAIAVDFQRRETIRGIVIVINTITGGESQAIQQLETEVHMSAYHIATAFLLIVQHDTQRIVLNGTIRVVIIISLGIQKFHTRRVVESNPQRIRTAQFQSADTFPRTSGSVEVECQVQPIGHLRLDICLGSISFIRTFLQRSFLFHIVTGNIRLQAFRPFREH